MILKKHRPEIDGLRAFAVVPVILHHAGLSMLPGGFLGVDMFFVISGYLITGILLSDLSQGKFSIRRFYERRIRRLLPALVVTLVLSSIVAIFLLLPGQLITFGEGMIAVALFVSNIFFWQTTNYFAATANLQPLLHTWSLAVEEQFYLFYPLVLFSIWHLERRALVALIVGAAVISFALAVWASNTMPVANFYLLPTRAWELLAGALCVFAYDKYPLTAHIQKILATVGLILIIMPVIFWDDSVALPSWGTLVPVAGTCLVLLYARAGQGLAGKILILRPAIFLGLVSYSAYLFHQPLFVFARIGWPEWDGPYVFTGLSVITFVLAGLSWRFIEQPFRRPSQYKNNAGQIRKPITMGLGVTIAIAGIGALFIVSKGLVIRYPVEDRVLALFDRINAGNYVRAQFTEAQLRPFNQTQPKLLIVGDSFGQDFYNVLHENGFLDHVSVSTHHISKQCGNLWAETSLAHHIAPRHAILCGREGRWGNVRLAPLVQQADLIILASDWQPWQWSYVRQTIKKISTQTDADILVVGRKDFGVINLKGILDTPYKDRLTLRNSLTPRQIAADAALTIAFATAQSMFLDMQTYLCPDPAGCPLVTPEGQLISYDGGHLTQAGAIWAGARLAPHLPRMLTFPH